MKIAFIYDAICPVKGGAEKRIYEIGRRLADKHEVHWYGIGWWLKDNIPEKEKLMNLAKELKVRGNVKFVGFLENHDDVIAYMKASKVFVLPSTREGFGIVALEANACGLPVVTVNHRRNAACDFINNGENGFICELSAEDIAEKILIGLEMGKIMRRKCVENAINYDWSKIANITESFYSCDYYDIT